MKQNTKFQSIPQIYIEEKTEKQTREEIIKENNKNTKRKITDGKYEEREINREEKMT